MKIKVFGIPSHAGALLEGTERAPNAIREAGLIERLRENHMVEDYGDLVDFNTLPRHNVGPVRNWPAPRMVWEAIIAKTEELFNPESFSIILGGDCSIEVGTFTSFRKVFGEKSYLLVVDGHLDTMPPTGDKCIGAAGMGLWFLTQDQKVWWQEGSTPASSVIVIGPHVIPEKHFGINVIPFENSIGSIDEVLKSIPEDGHIFVHFDVDVLHESVMPAAYSPSNLGLGYEEVVPLLATVLEDRRVKGIEVTEFSANKDTDGRSAEIIIELLCLISKKR